MAATVETGLEEGGFPNKSFKEMGDDGEEQQHEHMHLAPAEPLVLDAARTFDPAFAQLRPPFAFWQDFAVIILVGAAAGCFGWA